MSNCWISFRNDSSICFWFISVCSLFDLSSSLSSSFCLITLLSLAAKGLDELVVVAVLLLLCIDINPSSSSICCLSSMRKIFSCNDKFDGVSFRSIFDGDDDDAFFSSRFSAASLEIVLLLFSLKASEIFAFALCMNTFALLSASFTFLLAVSNAFVRSNANFSAFAHLASNSSRFSSIESTRVLAFTMSSFACDCTASSMSSFALSSCCNRCIFRFIFSICVSIVFFVVSSSSS